MAKPGRPTTEQDAQRLVDALTELGGSAGNTKLRAALKWEEDRYWRVRNGLVDSGIVELGKGKGGSVSLVEIEKPSRARPEQGELATYEPILKELRQVWLRQEGYERSIVSKSALLGKKATGGKWSRPDLVAAVLQEFEFVPAEASFISFEVKRAAALDITAVFEAVSHSRRCHYSHLLVVGAPSGAVTDSVSTVCREQGIGFIIAENPKSAENWIVQEVAQRQDPDPRDLNEFISTLFSAEDKQTIRLWMGKR